MSGRVALELWLCPGADRPVSVTLHILDPIDGTPTRSFGPQLRPCSSSGAPGSPASSRGRHEALEAALEAAGVHRSDSGGACPAAAVALEQAAASRQLDSPSCSSRAHPTLALQQTEPVSSSSSRSTPAAAPPTVDGPAQTADSATELEPAAPPHAAPPPQQAPQPLPPAAQAVAAAIQEAAAAADAAAGAAPQQPAAPPQASTEPARDSAAASAATAAGMAEPAGPSDGGGSTQAALASVMGMLQRLLEPGESAPEVQPEPGPPPPPPPLQPERQHQEPRSAAPPAAPALLPPTSPHPAATASTCPADSSGTGGASGGPLLPGGVQKLLALELEVVQLQQSLQIAQLEFETRSAQLHALKQRADEAEQRVQAAEERASGLAQQLRQLERQAGDLRCQLGEAAARHQQEVSQLAARLAAASAKQEAAEQEAACLRQQLFAARQAADEQQEQLRRSAAEQRAEWHEQVAALRREGQQLRSHIAAACAGLKGMGIPAHKVFGPSALAAAGVVQSPPESPAEAAELPSGTQLAQQAQHGQLAQQAQQAQHGQLAQQLQQAEQQASMRRPLVPRLQLSSISLQQLQAQASPVLQPAAAAPACGLPATELAAGPAAAGVAQQAHRRQQSDDSFAHVMMTADGTAALGGLAGPRSLQPAAAGGVAGAAGLAQATPSPASSVQQNSEFNSAPLLTARRAVSPAQQELLATARQWQRSARAAAADAGAAEEEPHAGYPPPLPSARGSARGPAPPSLFASGGTAGAAPRGACLPRHQTPRQAAAAAPAGVTPRRAAAGAGGPAGFPGTPGRKLAAARPSYGQDPTFQEIKAAYNAVMSSEADRTSRWARSVFSSASAVDADPARVDHMVQGLLQLFASNGLPIPLHKCGQCQYRLGPAGAKLSLRLVNGRLMARAGAGQTMDILAWLEKQPAGAGAAQQQHRSPMR